MQDRGVPKPPRMSQEGQLAMGTQNKYARMPIPPEHVAKHDVPLWDTRASMLANDFRKTRELFGQISGADLVKVLDTMRPNVENNYHAAVYYRAALHEAVVVRHWTVEWSALTNSHTIK